MTRKYTATARCSHEGCAKTQLFHATTRAEEKRMHRRIRTWLCTRHTDPEGVLGVDNRIVRSTYVAKHDKGQDKSFWDGRSGFIYGRDWKAFADDFPPGTRVEVTARVILPDALCDHGIELDEDGSGCPECDAA